MIQGFDIRATSSARQPGPASPARRLDPRPLEDREPAALGPRRHLRRRPLPGPHRHRTPRHGQHVWNLAISILRLAGHASIARALRHTARDPARALRLWPWTPDNGQRNGPGARPGTGGRGVRRVPCRRRGGRTTRRASGAYAGEDLFDPVACAAVLERVCSRPCGQVLLEVPGNLERLGKHRWYVRLLSALSPARTARFVTSGRRRPRGDLPLAERHRTARPELPGCSGPGGRGRSARRST